MDYSYNTCKAGVKEQVVDMAMKSSGIRDTARVLSISINVVIRILKNSPTAM
ncbi:IS1-like element transposase [Candidatus Fukatsuia symbiotica]|uniref:IS1-like element transposase n=1 Tax=Candidatus Fukatsuia symbiotica TaxID=1878942 RepID=UPI003B8A765F